MSASISARILSLLSAGSTLPAAIDAVLGAGTFTALVDDLYAALRTREG